MAGNSSLESKGQTRRIGRSEKERRQFGGDGYRR